MDSNTNFKRNVFWNILGTGLNSFNSLFLMIFVTRINGTNDAGIFTLAFSTACILYVVGVYSGRVFQVTESNESISDNDYLLGRFITVILMVAAAIIFVFYKRYDVYKAAIVVLLTVYKGLEALSDVLYGMMQKNDELYKVGQSYFVKSVLTLIGFLVIDVVSHNLILSILWVVCIWTISLIVIDYSWAKEYIRNSVSPSFNNVYIIIKSGFYVFAITFMGMYVTNASKYAIDMYLNNHYQAIYGIIIMPATAISLFGQFVFHPYLSQMARFNEERKYKELNKLTLKVVLYIALFGVLGEVAAYLLGIPVLSLLYGVDLKSYKMLLLIIIAAATMYNIGGTFSSMLTTMRKTFVQFVLYIILVIFAWWSADCLTSKYGINGAVYAYSILMIVFIALYVIVTKIILMKNMEK